MPNPSNSSNAIVAKVWSFCNALRDDGVGYGDYLEQLTYLIFLKMADEYSQPPHRKSLGIPDAYNWASLTCKSGAELEAHYGELLRELATEQGTLGQIFLKAQNKIQNPAMLYKIVNMIDGEKWTVLGADVKGDIYEGLLEKNAEDTKSGAGQYFTPRALISAMVDCIRPAPNKTIADPACGTGGFFLAAYDFLNNPDHYRLNKAQKQFLKFNTFAGNEIVPSTRRLCLMNMFLHNIGDIDGAVPVSSNDALIADSKDRYDYVLANPPFGKKSTTTITNADGEAEKEDFIYNRQDFLPPPLTSSSTLFSTFVPCLNLPAKLPLSSPITFFLKGAQAKPFAKNCSKPPNSTPFCAYLLASSTPTGLKPMSYFLTITLPAKTPGQKTYGSTTTGLIFTIH